MFVKRRVRQLQKEASRVVAFTQKALRRGTDFDPAARAEVERRLNRLDQLTRDDNADPAELAVEIRDMKIVVDTHLPVHRSYVVREYTEAIVVALALALVIRAFIIQAFKIPSGSMIPTLLVGDHLIVNKFMYGFEIPFTGRKILPLRKPSRGDIIVFRFPQDETKDFIKRVVGTPGDKVELRDKELYVNGEKVPREFEGEYTYADTNGTEQSAQLYEETLNGVRHPILLTDTYISPMDNFERTVPEGKYFCMGDNRDRSNDSRYWGFVDFNEIRGKAMIIYFSWPPSQWTRIFSLTR